MPTPKAPGMKRGRSSIGVTKFTNVADARSGLGLGKGNAGATGTGAVASTGGVGAGVDRVVLGISFTSQ